MKKLFAFIMTACAMLSANAQENVFRLSGQLEETGDSVIMYMADANKMSLIDSLSIVVCENAFETTLDIKEPVALVLYSKKGEALNNEPIQVLALPQEHCILTGKWSEYEMDGSQFYKDFNEVEKMSESIKKEAEELIAECQKRLEAGEEQATVVEYYQTNLGTILEKLGKSQTDFIKANADNDVAAVMFLPTASYMDSEKTMEMYALLSDKVKNGKMKPILDAAIARINEEMERKEQAKNIDEGKPAPDFTLNDINGKPLSLSSLRGKYVIIDFWGSWCGWCIKGMPKMKEYYAKYADKLEILGVDCGDSDENWKNAVKQHELPWKHVYHTDDSNVTTLYAIEGFPTKIVVDPQGNIAKVIVGEDPAFYEYLDELFK